MSTTAAIFSAYSGDMTDAKRGNAIQERLDALGISDREFHEQSGIDRKTLRRAILGEERVRPSTYDAIESALTKLEQKMRPNVTTGDLMEIRAEGVFGIQSIVVGGPVADRDALVETIAKLIERVRHDEGRNGNDA